jgi:prolyl-tRNA editing enzyme YbaK/EbsC (Cys-tRNA(Pro) deacylase)
LLKFEPVLNRPDLVPTTVFEIVKNWTGPQDPLDFLVAEIDPEYAGGVELCNKYNVDPKKGANCLVVEGRRGQNKIMASCLVPVGYKYDMSGVVRKHLNVRQVSVAPLDYVIENSKMEFGSITPIGLPKEWLVFIDPLVLKEERIIIGGGLKKSKLSIPSEVLLSLPGAIKLEGLAKKVMEE